MSALLRAAIVVLVANNAALAAEPDGGRLYANQMVDRPYTRYGMTDDMQNQIVPTLIRQEP